MVITLPQIHTSTTGIAPSVGLPASNPKPTKPQRVRGFRRPNRDLETSDQVVLRAIPEGMQRPKHTDEVLDALKAHPDFAIIRADRRDALVRCIEALISAADYKTMTTRPTWAKLAATLGVVRRTIARYLHQLRTMGLLGVVASGRSVDYAARGKDGQRTNESAVYVLCIPEKPRALKKFFGRVFGVGRGAVDGSVTPPSLAGYYLSNNQVNPRTRARNVGSKSEEQKRLGYSVHQIRWNRHWVPQGRRQCLTAAWRLKTVVPNVLGRMSDRDVAASIRVFFEAGWTVDDIHHALDRRPDGSAWPHSGAPATKEPHRVRGWLKYRLSAWLDERERPLLSKAQLDQARREKLSYERQIEAEREAEHRQRVRNVDPAVRDTALAEIRKLLRRK